MRRLILVVILLLLIGASVGTVTILARQSQSAALAAARSRQATLATLTTANVELGLKSEDLLAVRDFLQSLQSDPAFAGGLLLDIDGDPILSVPSDFSLREEILQSTLSKGHTLYGNTAYRVAPLSDDGEFLGHFLIALSEEQIYADATEALVFTAKVGLALMLPVSALIAWLLSWMETQLQKGEKALRATSSELTLMLDNLGQGVLTFSKDGIVGAIHSRQANSLLRRRVLHGLTSRIFSSRAKRNGRNWSSGSSSFTNLAFSRTGAGAKDSIHCSSGLWETANRPGRSHSSIARSSKMSAWREFSSSRRTSLPPSRPKMLLRRHGRSGTPRFESSRASSLRNPPF